MMKSGARLQPFERSLMHDLARYIDEHSDERITLEALSEQAHLSPSHLQRRFKAAIGLSPREYQESCRLRKLRSSLRVQPSVTAAIYETGFGSASRVYERVERRLGMTPGQYRDAGKNLQISYAGANTVLGEMMIGATDRGICFLQFGDSPEDLLNQLKREFPKAAFGKMTAAHRDQFDLWMAALSSYLRGQSSSLDLPLDIRGTAFQLKVWKYLQSIPPGQVRSYGEVAGELGAPKAVRAVAGACARNAVAIVIPCHRVVRGNGELAGYRWGLERKRALLDLERNSALPAESVPEPPGVLG